MCLLVCAKGDLVAATTCDFQVLASSEAMFYEGLDTAVRHYLAARRPASGAPWSVGIQDSGAADCDARHLRKLRDALRRPAVTPVAKAAACATRWAMFVKRTPFGASPWAALLSGCRLARPDHTPETNYSMPDAETHTLPQHPEGKMSLAVVSANSQVRWLHNPNMEHACAW